jgi:hypothetical protein
MCPGYVKAAASALPVSADSASYGIILPLTATECKGVLNPSACKLTWLEHNPKHPTKTRLGSSTWAGPQQVWGAPVTGVVLGSPGVIVADQALPMYGCTDALRCCC